MPTHIIPTLTGTTKGIHLLGRGSSCGDSVVKCGGGGYLSQFNLLYYISHRRLNDLYTAKGMIFSVNQIGVLHFTSVYCEVTLVFDCSNRFVLSGGSGNSLQFIGILL